MDNNNLNIEQRLDRIEELLLSQKTVFNINEVAQYTGLSIDYIYKLTHKQKIPFSKPGGKLLYFDRTEIDRWLISNPSKTVDQMQSISANHLVHNGKHL